jgi:hypothetical protein
MPNDHLDQAFRSALPFIDQVGVVVGLDPNNDHGGPHTLRIQLLSSSGKVLAGGYAALVNNGETVIPLPDLHVEPNEVYRIRVYNTSTAVLGIYLSDSHQPTDILSNDGSASINGVSQPGILCGYVEGRTLKD